MTTIVMGDDKIDHVIKLKGAGKIDTIANIVLMDQVSADEVSKLEEAGLNVFDFYQLIEEGEKNRVKLTKPSHDTVFTI